MKGATYTRQRPPTTWAFVEDPDMPTFGKKNKKRRRQEKKNTSSETVRVPVNPDT